MPFLQIDDVVGASDLGEFVVIVGAEGIAVVSDEQMSDNEDHPRCLLPSSWFEQSLKDSHTSQLISLGSISGKQAVLLEESFLSAPVSTLVELNLSFITAREFMMTASPLESDIVSRALQLSKWTKEHRYCSACGSPASLANNDRAFVCTSCGFRMYPRISPCVIGVIVRNSQILLAHGRNHKANIYSALAGFIEVGETPEQAFAREVKEEVGLEICNIRYIQSQSWPFPGQLMLGFVADFKAGTIVLEEQEIVDAGWFDKDHLPELPPPFTISAKLIEHALGEME